MTGWCVICDAYCRSPETHTDEDRRLRAQTFRFRRSPRKLSAVRAQCGTLSGRGWHERRGEPLCEDCKQARRDYAKRRYDEQKALAQ